MNISEVVMRVSLPVQSKLKASEDETEIKMRNKLMEKREEVQSGVQEIFKDKEVISDYVKEVEALKVS